MLVYKVSLNTWSLTMYDLETESVLRKLWKWLKITPPEENGSKVEKTSTFF